MKAKFLTALAFALALGSGLEAGRDHKKDGAHDHSHGADGHSHAEVGAFEPPHGGAFTRLADHWIEFYLEGDKAYLCMFEPDGKPTEDEHTPKNIVLKLKGKGMKATTLKAGTAMGGCASWEFSTKAKLVRVQVSALVDGRKESAKLNLENRRKKSGGAKTKP